MKKLVSEFLSENKILEQIFNSKSSDCKLSWSSRGEGIENFLEERRMSFNIKFKFSKDKS